MIDDIQKITTSYISISKSSIDQAREFYVEIAEEYLKRVNQNTSIRPFLHNYPFDINNLDLTISFKADDGKYPEYSDVALMYVIRGELIYNEYDEEQKEYIRLHKEPYSKAVKLAGLNN